MPESQVQLTQYDSFTDRKLPSYKLTIHPDKQGLEFLHLVDYLWHNWANGSHTQKKIQWDIPIFGNTNWNFVT